MNIRIITCFLILLAAVSCTRHDSRLAAADSIMESAPETALEQLQQIQPSALSEDDYAYYALLYTQAQDKCDVINTSDSLISVAYQKYINDGSKNLKMRAYFYNAVVSFYKSDFKSSMKDAIASYDIAKETDDHYWIAKTAELMADILWKVYNYPQSEFYTREAVENYLLAGRIDNHRYALCVLASIYMNEDKVDKGIALVDSLYSVVTNETPVDSALLDYMSMVKASSLLRTNQIALLDKVLETPDIIKNDADSKVTVSIINSILYLTNGDSEDAEEFLSDAYRFAEDEMQRIRVMYQDFKQSLSSGQYKKAAVLADSVILVQSGIVGELLKESVTAEQGDYYSEKAMYQQRLAELRLYALGALAIVALIITMLIIRNYRLKARAKKAEFEANISSLLQFRNIAESAEKENKRLCKELERLYRDNCGTLNMLCDKYFDMENLGLDMTVILGKIQRELKRLKTKKNLNEIEKAVDSYMGNIMTMLRNECAFFKEDDFVFLSLVFAGFSSRAVCLLMDIKYKLFYLKRDRLSERIAESEVPHKVLFLSRIK